MAERCETTAKKRGIPRKWPISWQNALQRPVATLLIEDYEAGAFTYELAEQYSMRHNTFRRAELDFSPEVKRAARTDEQKVEALLLLASGTIRRERMKMYGVGESIIKQGLSLPITITTG